MPTSTPQTPSATQASSSLHTRHAIHDEADPGYPQVSRLLHWLVAGGIVLQFVLGEQAEEAAAANDLPTQLATLALHKSVGMTVLMLAILRVAWRLLQPPMFPQAHPQSATNPQAKYSALQARLAGFAHLLLYGLLFFLPLSGWLMSSASAYSVSWFNLFQFPDLIQPDEDAKALLQSLHNIAGKLLLVVAVLHIAAACKHYFLDKDGVMGRMSNISGIAVFVVTVIAGLTLSSASMSSAPASGPSSEPFSAPLSPPPIADSSTPVQPTLSVPASSSASAADLTPSISPAATIPLWQVDSNNSHIHFKAEQAGASFDGQWLSFDPQIHFAADDLASSSATVTIDATSVATADSERDDTLAGADWFDTSNFADIVFQTQKINRSAHGFTAEATLAIRGMSYPVSFDFQINEQNGVTTLTGSSRLDRLALNLGTIEWLDTEWVGQFVDVNVVVTTLP